MSQVKIEHEVEIKQKVISIGEEPKGVVEYTLIDALKELTTLKQAFLDVGKTLEKCADRWNDNFYYDSRKALQKHKELLDTLKSSEASEDNTLKGN